MEKIKRYIECNLSPEVCNLDCKYCYLMQENRKNQGTKKLDFSPDFVASAISPKRMGGICFVSLAVAGETLHSEFIIELAKKLASNGHYVNITTNGTLTKQFAKLLMDEKLNRKFLITFSCHYIELKKKFLKNIFWDNVKMVRAAGSSICVKLNLYDEYIPLLDEIYEECVRNTGAPPQLELTRKEVANTHVLYSKYDINNYRRFGQRFNSKLFEFTCDNFKKKREKFFCHAGDWTMVLDLATGEAKGCYCDYRTQNIYSNLSKEVVFSPIGNNCSGYCHNAQHFLAWGAIRELDEYSYGVIRNRESANWQNEEFRQFASHFLHENNREYSKIERLYYNLRYLLGKRL